MGFDISPRRVWFGTTVPGKKMMAMLKPDAGIERGRDLIDLYGGEPHMALMAVALALHALPKEGVVGPAFRDLRKPLLPVPAALFGAMLTDIRDFLKFRFRTTGLTDAGLASREAMLEDLTAGRFPAGVEPGEPERAINYVISALDALSREREVMTDFVGACGKLRDLLRATSKSLNPRRGLDPAWDEADDKFEDSLFEER